MDSLKSISRRNFLKGAGAVAASSLLPHFPNIVRAENHEINVIGWGGDTFETLFEQATEATGITINAEGLPARWSDVMQKFTLWGQTGYSHIDIMMTDDLLAGMYGMNGWALDLSDLNAYNDNVDDITDSAKVLDSAMGGVYRLFYFMGATPFFRNADLVPDAPATWDDFVAAGLASTDQDAGVWGWRPLGGQGHAFNTMLMALHHSGADLDELNDDATRAALQWMYDWVNDYEITPPSTVNEGWTEVIGLMAGGKAGMCWGYEGMYNSVTTTVDTVVTEENFKLSRFPMGPANDNLLLHGWGYTIPSALHQDRAGAGCHGIPGPSRSTAVCRAEQCRARLEVLLQRRRNPGEDSSPRRRAWLGGADPRRAIPLSDREQPPGRAALVHVRPAGRDDPVRRAQCGRSLPMGAGRVHHHQAGLLSRRPARIPLVLLPFPKLRGGAWREVGSIAGMI